MRNKKWPLAAAAALSAALALAACGGDDPENAGHDMGGHGTVASGPGNATDSMFVHGMIPHHEGAIEMAQIAGKRAEHPEIRELADDIIRAQKREIALMSPLREKLAREHGSAQMDGGHGMGMGEGDIADLESADPFDRAFIDLMVPHHEGAVTMAKAELAKGENETLRELADDIISAQKREIDQMQSWRDEWYGTAGGSGDESMGHGSAGMH